MIKERDTLRLKLQEIENKTSEVWVYFQGSLYLGSSSEMTWQESRQYCQDRGADLSIITSVQEQEFARVAFKEHRWIGLSDLEQEGVWKWVDELLVQGEPNSLGDEDCGELNFNDHLNNWNDINCAHKRKSICWVYFQSSLYLGSSTEQSWQQSRQYCQERGADLTVITSVQEQEFARVTFKERRWIGLSDLEQEGVWTWVNGSPSNTRFTWTFMIQTKH
ncbi:hypothetical protein WMY93_008144 [Mugilogobius chulae]|uniref:C-type lectin domain-containing protein n=1 Tax=Mugilogobius chulae TaxID=88201 RepID=A0AAW0PF23_9GOBI